MLSESRPEGMAKNEPEETRKDDPEARTKASGSARYCLITPVRDEERFIARTIESVLAQTVKPLEWIIVDDGSSDRTASIVAPYAERYSWIHMLRRSDRGYGSKGGGVEAFLEAFPLLKPQNWEYLANLDGDMTFDADYFERCFEKFRSMPRLGIGGGTVFADIGGHWQPEQAPAFHVRGAAKIYRRECWEAIGGLWSGLGWDTVDEVKANQLGWSTQSFPDIKLLHHRQSGTRWGAWGFSILDGEADYTVGYLPLFFGLKCVRHIVNTPFLLRSIGMAYGYLRSMAQGVPRVNDPAFVEYLRRQQFRRIVGLSSIWK